MGPAVLSCHPSTPTDAVRRLAARVTRTDGTLRITFTLDADVARLRIPAPRPPRIAPRLWQHTCFEAFVAADGPAYHEFNFAPSGEWAAYAFGRYRDGAPIAQDLTPRITARRTVDRLELDAVVRLDWLPGLRTCTSLRLALCAVVEADNSVLSYWALKHAPGAPDFHHPEAFAWLLPLPEANAVDRSARGER